MNKLSKYNDFKTEREFDKIVFGIYKLVESAYTQEWDLTGDDSVKVGDTIEWDLTPEKPFEPIKDKPAKQIVWDLTKDIEKQSKSIKDYINYVKSAAKGVKSKAKRFRDYMNEGEVDIEFDMNSDVFKQIGLFIKKLDKKQIKEYFFKLLEKFNGLSHGVKRDLFVKLSLLIIGASNLQIGDLISDSDAESDKFLSEVKISVIEEKQKEKEKEVVKVIKSDEVEKEVTETGGATFDNANKLVSLAEGGYTDNPIDAGNWTDGPDSKSGHLIGTNRGIAAFTIIKTNTKPTSDAEIRALKQCYGSKYEKFCGRRLLSFGEQWRLDQKYIDSKNIGIKWKNIQKVLSKETATEIYENEYWNIHDFSKIKNQSIANILYDACVNQGPGVPGNVFISSMKKLGYNVSDVNNWDDIHSKLTPIVNSMNTNQLKKLHHEIGLQRLQRYGVNKSEDEMTADEKEFSDGWKNRINKEDINKFEEGDVS